MTGGLPKYWSILYALHRLTRIGTSFDLQKYLYLAKVNSNVPIEYIFVDEDYGPCCSSIKQDAQHLGDLGYLDVSFESGWVFKITEAGEKQVEEFIHDVPEDVQKSFDHILQECSSLSLLQLREGAGDLGKEPKTREEYEQLKKQLLAEIELLLNEFSYFESNGNSLFVRGSLDYFQLVLKRENLDDIQKVNLLILINGYLKKIVLLRELTRENPELLEHLCLNDLKEDFELAQMACVDYKVLPALFDEDIDLSAFVEEY